MIDVGIPHHVMDLASEGIGNVIDSVTEHPNTFRSLSALVIGSFNRGEDRFQELSWHIDCAWGHWVISLH